MSYMSKGAAEYYKKMFPPGTRVELDSMGDDPNPIPSGTKGTISYIDDAGTLHTEFDNGRFLGICLGADFRSDVDRFHRIEDAPTQNAEKQEQKEQTEEMPDEPQMSM